MQIENIPYSPDDDPLIQRARARGPKGGRTWLWLLIALFATAWSLERFGIFPKRSYREATELSTPQFVSSSASKGGRPDGPFRIGGLLGETRFFGVSACLEGKGNAALEASTGLSMCFAADVQVTTLSIDNEGTVVLQFTCDDANLTGNFFGFPVDLRRRNGVTTSFADKSIIPVRTAANARFEAPDERTFGHPLIMTIAHNGVVQDVQHEGGLGLVFLTICRLAAVDFPASSLQFGDVWESKFNVNLPGIKADIPIHLRSTLVGEEVFWGRTCERFDQTALPVTAPASTTGKVLDKLTGGIGPRFVTSGVVTSYFDLNYGQLVYSEMDLNFDLEMGDSLEAVANLLGAYIGLLDEIEGGEKFDFDRDTSEAPGLHVTATLTLK